MSAQIVPMHPSPNQQPNGFGTFGCLAPVDITPLDALLDDIHRTQAHILWLEHFIATIEPAQVFASPAQTTTSEHEQSRFSKPTIQGTPRVFAQIDRRSKATNQSLRLATHPAITTLQSQQAHLVDACYKATMLGIKLDQIDFSRSQADRLLAAIQSTVTSLGHDQSDPTVQSIIEQALQTVQNG
ncbi:MAG TPA: hypothetical protein VH187_22290 [Scandinavium sp.]|uniref:hypothetical protein n=1 Tax=Scandinavium sp. TaxID=2830653 RepID=UPI002E36E407|nr:hypothetical protein [Scandinavium sp.]HEX4503865.1 hypothetical protein [Scandinavium sp.]